MTIDFELGKAPGFRGATVAWTAEWSDKRIRSEFEKIAAQLSAARVRTGRWFLIEKGNDRFRVAIEVRSASTVRGAFQVRQFPASAVYRVRFDPDEVSARVVYHGLNDFLRYRKKDKTIRSVGDYREVYEGNPWTDARAWKRATVEALVRR